MYRQFGNSDYRNGFAGSERDNLKIGQSGQLDALVALERIGTRLSFSRNDEMYAEGDRADCWYTVVSGTVRICIVDDDEWVADSLRSLLETFGFESSRIFRQPNSWQMIRGAPWAA